MLDIIILLHPFCQLKISTQSMPMKLGGGQLGYLSLVLSTEDYNSISSKVPFEHPTDPEVFQYVLI